jgi:hypothetical protein
MDTMRKAPPSVALFSYVGFIGDSNARQEGVKREKLSLRMLIEIFNFFHINYPALF